MRIKNNTPSVLGIGIATIDSLFTVSQYPEKDTKIRCSSYTTQGGGNCANTMVALSRLGVNTSIYTWIGRDEIGKAIKKSLSSEGVNTDMVIEQGNVSPLSVIIVGEDDSSRTIIHRPGVDYNSKLPARLPPLSGYALLYSDGRFSRTALLLARDAREKKLPVIVEAERTGLDAEQLFSYADILITSRDYHQQCFQNTDIKANITRRKKKCPGIVITTLGKEGCLCFAGDSFLRKPAYKTDAVDTTGAGDAFCAGIIYGTLQGWEIEKRIDFASLVAAFKCRKPGARGGLPYLHELKRFPLHTM
jgi:sugar/nucleoside kinase (ribokinase family)